MDLISSVVLYHVATHTQTLRLVHSGVWGSWNSPDTGGGPTSHVTQTQKVLPPQSLESVLVS